MENNTNYFDNLIAERKAIMSELKPLEKEYNDLVSKNASISEKNVVARRINDLVNRVEEIDGELAYYVKQLKDMENHPAERVVEEPIRVVEVEKAAGKEKNGARGLSLALVALLGFGTGFVAYHINKNTNCAGNNKSIDRTVVAEINDAIVAHDNVTPVPTAEPVVEVTATPVLVDPSNEEDVLNAVDRIYEEDLNSMIAGLNNPAFEAQVSREDIADIVRFVNAELPLYRTYDSTTFGELANKFVYVYGAQGGHGNELYPVHYEYLARDNSTLAKYCKSYDDIYNKIAEYRKAGNVDGFIEAVGELSSKLYNEWHVFGMYGGFNPYQFNEKEQFLAFNAAVGRYANYVKEYLISNNLTICIPTCYEVDGETFVVAENAKEVETRDIYEAILYGTSKNGEISIVVGSDVLNPNAMVGQNLIKILDEKAEQNVKVLK